MDAITNVPVPHNEPVREYAPGSAERSRISAALAAVSSSIDLPMTINGEQRMASGEPIEVRAPHRHAQILGTTGNATAKDARAAADAALEAAPEWQAMSLDERASI